MKVTLNSLDNYFCVALIDNRKNAPICILDENYRETIGNLEKSLHLFLVLTVFCILSTELYLLTRYITDIRKI